MASLCISCESNEFGKSYFNYDESDKSGKSYMELVYWEKTTPKSNDRQYA